MRILKKAGYKKAGLDDQAYLALTKGSDFELIKLIGSAQEHVEKAASQYSPNVIADYVSDLTALFSTFYESMPVIGSEAQPLRLALVDAYAITLRSMLGLLGIRTVDEM
jgi:arginyl-tRNA synthetase